MLLLIILDPVDCTYSEWEQYGACSVTCGKGTKTRSRVISTTDSHGGKKCVERLEQIIECDRSECPGNVTISVTNDAYNALINFFTIKSLKIFCKIAISDPFES